MGIWLAIAVNGMLIAADLLVRHRHLLVALAGRDIRDRYVGSAIGAAWSILQPLALIVVMLVVFKEAAAVPRGGSATADGATGYAVRTVAAFIPWHYTGIVIAAAAAVIRSNQSLVTQIEFPVAILPAKIVVSAMLIETVLFLLLIAYSWIFEGRAPQLSLSLLPVALLLQFVFLLGLAWIVAVLGMYFRDIEQALPTLIFINLYLLPIFFTAESAPSAIAGIVERNPFTPMVTVFQSTITGMAFALPGAWMIFALISVTTFLFGWWLFQSLKEGFGDLF